MNIIVAFLCSSLFLDVLQCSVGHSENRGAEPTLFSKWGAQAPPYFSATATAQRFEAAAASIEVATT